MTEASKDAYKRSRDLSLSHKARIYDVIKWSITTEQAGWTAIEMGRELKLPVLSMVKRLSDLFKDGKVKVVGTRKGFSVYKEDLHRKRMTLSQAYHIALNQYCSEEQVKNINELVKYLT